MGILQSDTEDYLCNDVNVVLKHLGNPLAARSDSLLDCRTEARAFEEAQQIALSYQCNQSLSCSSRAPGNIEQASDLDFCYQQNISV